MIDKKKLRITLFLIGALAMLALVAPMPSGMAGNPLGASESCASEEIIGDGSCGPCTGWVCGLNGQNYDDKKYYAAQ
jgi:hypothetical protein